MNPKIILIADDDPASRQLAAAVLRARGYDVIEAEDGWEAWNAAAERWPDLVISDIQMPKLGGFELLQRLRQSRLAPILPVMAVSAHAMAGERERALAAGFAIYITKPVDLAQLRQAVEILLQDS